MAVAHQFPRPLLRRATLVIAILLAVGAVAVTTWRCVHSTDGRLIYALDDAYIHLAMGRTLAERGIWGVNARTPGAASSSPLWTLLIAGAVKLVGVQTWLPLALNLMAAALLAAVAEAWLREFGLPSGVRILVIAVVIAVGPVGPLAITGMEHVAHAAAVLTLVLLALRRRPGPPLTLALMAAVATGLRYESTFVVAALAVVLMLRRDRPRAVAMIAGSVAVVVTVGLVQLSRGEGFLPNSLIVKAAGVTAANSGAWLRGKIYRAMEQAYETPLVMLPLLAVLLAFAASLRRSGEDAEPSSSVRVALEGAAALTLASLMHIILARTGWYHRYEAYLLIWGVVAVVGSFQEWRKRCPDAEQRMSAGDARSVALLAWAGVGLLVLLALGLRINAYNTAPRACRDIYTQHYQMARFVKRYYDGRPIVVHDIGYIGFLTESPILDMAGLASHEVAVAKSQGRLNQQYADEVARRHEAVIAISYDHNWVPATWRRVASWRTRNIRVAGRDTVYFFAVEPSEAEVLRAHLQEFASSLPAGVTVHYFTGE